MIKRKLLSGGFKKANSVICPFPPCLFACLRWLIFAWFFPMLSIIFVRRHSGSLDLRCSAPVPSVFVILCAQHHYFIICELKAASAKTIVEFTLLRESNCAREPSLSYLDCLQFSGQRFGKTLPAVFSGKLLTNIAICDSLYTLSAEYRCSPITVFPKTGSPHLKCSNPVFD